MEIPWTETSFQPFALPHSFGFTHHFVNKWSNDLNSATNLFRQSNTAGAERLYIRVTDDLLKFSNEGLELRVSEAKKYPPPSRRGGGFLDFFGMTCIIPSNSNEDEFNAAVSVEDDILIYTVEQISTVPEFSEVLKQISRMLEEPIILEIAKSIHHRNSVLQSDLTGFDHVLSSLASPVMPNSRNLIIDLDDPTSDQKSKSVCRSSPTNNSNTGNRNHVLRLSTSDGAQMTVALSKSEAQSLSRVNLRKKSVHDSGESSVGDSNNNFAFIRSESITSKKNSPSGNDHTSKISSQFNNSNYKFLKGKVFRDATLSGDGSLTASDVENIETFIADIHLLFEEVELLYSEEKIMTAIKVWSALESIVFRACESLSNSSSKNSDAVSASDEIQNLHSRWQKSKLIQELLIKKEVAENGLALLKEPATPELGWSVTKHSHHFSFMKVMPNNEMIFRCEGVVEEPIFNMMSILNESDLHIKWVPYANKTELTHQCSRVTQIGFHEYSLPWPLTNRSTYTFGFGIDMMDEDEESVVIVAYGIPDTMKSFLGFNLPTYKNTQMKLKAFAFSLTPGEHENRTYVSFVASLDPQIDIVPAFIMNASMRLLTNGMFTNIMKQATNFKNTEYPQRVKSKRNVYEFLEKRMHQLRFVEGRTFENTPAARAHKSRLSDSNDPNCNYNLSPSLKVLKQQADENSGKIAENRLDSPAFRHAMYVVEQIESRKDLVANGTNPAVSGIEEEDEADANDSQNSLLDKKQPTKNHPSTGQVNQLVDNEPLPPVILSTKLVPENASISNNGLEKETKIQPSIIEDVPVETKKGFGAKSSTLPVVIDRDGSNGGCCKGKKK